MLSPKDLRIIRKMRKHGIVNPVIAFQEARRAHCPIPVLCAVLMQETGGGRNIFGHDPTIFVGAGTVTKKKYLAYKARRKKGGFQGVGPMQLTYGGYQDEADSLGGCWKVRFNIRVGAGHLARKIKGSGIWYALRDYNGSEDYANVVFHSVKLWEAYLGTS